MRHLLRTSLVLLLIGGTLALQAPEARPGEEPSPGPPWHADWASVKAEAIQSGRPIFAYFTKKH